MFHMEQYSKERTNRHCSMWNIDTLRKVHISKLMHRLTAPRL